MNKSLQIAMKNKEYGKKGIKMVEENTEISHPPLPYECIKITTVCGKRLTEIDLETGGMALLQPRLTKIHMECS